MDLSFLEPDQTYLAEVYRDGKNADWKTNPYDYVIESYKVNSASKISLNLATSGGTAIRFKKIVM